MATINLDSIGDKIIAMLSHKSEARERAIPLSRETIRHCANSIRATHRGDFSRAEELLEAAHIRLEEMKQALADHLDLRYGGFVFDAEKEYAEARTTMALVRGDPLPDPDGLGVGYAAYLNGLGEAVGEMRRHLLDVLRRGDPPRIEELLSSLDDIYNLLISVDFPDAITSGLRRTTDVARGVLEKTRGDITLAFQQRSLERRLREIEADLGTTVSPETLALLKRPLRRRPAAASAAKSKEVAAPVTEAAPGTGDETAKPKRRRRKKAVTPEETTTPAVEMAPEPIQAVAPEAATEEAATKPKRRRRRRKKTATDEAALEVEVVPEPIQAVAPEAATEEEEATKPKRRRRRRKKTATDEATLEVEVAPESIQAVAPEAAAEVLTKAKRRRRRRKRAAAAASVEAAGPSAEASLEPGEAAAAGLAGAPARPKRRWWPFG